MRVYVIGILFLLFTLVCQAVNVEDQEVKLVGDKNYQNNSSLVYDGIDISNYQKDINWDATVKDGNIKYVYIKATEGASHKQHRYRTNIEHARKRGIKVGSYHFMTTTATIQKQFENFISVVKPEEQDLVPLLDVEKRDGWSIKQLQDSVMKFVQLLEDYYGCKPMIYASSNYFNNYLGASFKSYPLFIARYSKNEPQLSYGAKWILWQFSDRGRIEGIDALVDLSRFNKGCGVKDISYKPKGHQAPKPRRNRGDVPRPKPKEKKEPAAVPPPPAKNNASNGSRTEKTDAQKRGEESARKRQKQVEEQRKKEEEQRKKEEEKRKKEEEKRKKEEEKRKKEAEKQKKEEAKKKQEQEKKRKEEEKRRKEEEKRRLEEKAKQHSHAQAQERMKQEKENLAQNDKAQQAERDQQRKDDLEKTRQERINNQRKKETASTQATPAASRPSSPRRRMGNQSSADNEAVNYNSQRRNHAKNKD
ncbi:MAG: hypothetical protein IKX31_10920 [Muribaculaceae bacterium]|nr:hypothetical protein [Muribaculaceae bacterium]